MIYIDDKPILLVCDNAVYVKTLPQLEIIMRDEPKSFPYKGAKAHHILDIENEKLVNLVIPILLQNVMPYKKNNKHEKK